MSNVINKSNHPVEIKKISISMWSLRDEIETAIAKRIEKDPEAEPDVQDINIYYTTILNADIGNSSEEDDDGDERQDDNLDSSGNPMDEDAAAMMAALAGGDDDEAEDSTEDDSEQVDDAAEASEEDDEAARLAAEMLGDQGGAPAAEENEDQDDEAAMLAAQMLADQGMGEDTPKQEESKKPLTFNEVAKTFKRPTPKQKTEAFLMLSDITMDSCLLFTKGPFIQGQNVVVRFNIPNSFMLLGTVIRCMDISRNSKIISSGKPSHRLYVRFELKFPGERDSLRNFLKSIEPTIPAPPKKMKRPESDEEDDDFDDLGF